MGVASMRRGGVRVGPGQCEPCSSFGGCSQQNPTEIFFSKNVLVLNSQHDRMGEIFETADEAEFNRKMAENRGRLVVIDFYATWCGPCKAIAPKFKKMAVEFSNALFMKVDVDEAEDIVSKYDIKVMPTFILVKNGENVDSVEGGSEEDLRSKIVKHI